MWVEREREREMSSSSHPKQGGSTSQFKHGLEVMFGKTRKEVSLSAFSFLMTGIVHYFQERVSDVADLEKSLEELGHGVGIRMLEMCCYRDKSSKRELKHVGMLQFISTTIWMTLFGKKADSLERSVDSDCEYMIGERESLVTKFISVPRDMGEVNCAAFCAGIIQGVLESGSFPCSVTAHFVPVEGEPIDRIVYLVRFDPAVLAREK